MKTLSKIRIFPTKIQLQKQKSWFLHDKIIFFDLDFFLGKVWICTWHFRALRRHSVTFPTFARGSVRKTLDFADFWGFFAEGFIWAPNPWFLSSGRFWATLAGSVWRRKVPASPLGCPGEFSGMFLLVSRPGNDFFQLKFNVNSRKPQEIPRKSMKIAKIQWKLRKIEGNHVP